MEPHSKAVSKKYPLPLAVNRPSRVGPALILTLLAVFSLLGIALAQTSTPAPARSTPPTFSGTTIGFSVAVVLLLTLLNGAFAMAEGALLAVRTSRVEQLVEEGRRGARTVQMLTQDPPRFIATIQIAITFLGFTSVALAAIALAGPLVPHLESVPLLAPYALPLAVLLVTLVHAIVYLVLGIIAPRALASHHPDQWALRFAPLVRAGSLVLAPIISLVIGLSNLLVRPFGANARFETPMITREEFEQIIDQTEQHGEIDDQEAKIITNVFDLSETSIRSVMTPRIDMTALAVDAPLSLTLETILESGHSRIPVYEGTIDNIVGIVHAKDLLPHFKAARQNVNLREVARAAYFVPESRRVSDLLTEMRRSKNQLAIVQDEYAGTEGLITIEDLLEEIVGDIRDEYDVDEPEVQVLSPTESLIDGRMSIDDVNDRLALDLPHRDYDTIGGLVFGLLGHEPVPGETVEVEGVTFRVEAMEAGRVQSVRALQTLPSPPDGEEATG